MRVLLLEDNADAAEALAGALTELNGEYRILWAARLKDAEEIVRAGNPDVALVDLRLPDARGCEAAVALRGIAPDLPVVALTGSDFDAIALELVRCGVQDYLQKGNTSVQRIHQVLQLAAERRRQESMWRRHACYDWLTGALSRYEIEQQLASAISRSCRVASLGAVMVVDIDDFKSINDTHGHGAGDVVLTEVVRRLTAATRAGDSIGRLGGDEFALIVEGLKCGEDACVAARRAVETTNFDVVYRGAVVPVSTSIGVAIFPEEHSDVQGLLELADDAMYRAKRSGKATFRFSVSQANEDRTEGRRGSRAEHGADAHLGRQVER